MGGLTKEYSLVADDVYCWDLKNDQVTRRKHMPCLIFDIYLVASSDKIYGVSGETFINGEDWEINGETLCYSISDDSWTILPQGFFIERGGYI